MPDDNGTVRDAAGRLHEVLQGLMIEAGNPKLDGLVRRIEQMTTTDRTPRAQTLSDRLTGKHVPRKFEQLELLAQALSELAVHLHGSSSYTAQVRRRMRALFEAARHTNSPTPRTVSDPRTWPLAMEVAPDALGAHRALVVDGAPAIPPYVPRDRDAELRACVLAAADSGGLVVVEGESGAGKTRSAAHALHELLGDRRLFIPDSAEELPAAPRCPHVPTCRPCCGSTISSASYAA